MMIGAIVKLNIGILTSVYQRVTKGVSVCVHACVTSVSINKS